MRVGGETAEADLLFAFKSGLFSIYITVLTTRQFFLYEIVSSTFISTPQMANAREREYTISPTFFFLLS